MSANSTVEIDPTMSAIRDVLDAPDPSGEPVEIDVDTNGSVVEVPEVSVPEVSVAESHASLHASDTAQERQETPQETEDLRPSRFGRGLKMPKFGAMTLPAFGQIKLPTKLPFQPTRRHAMWAAVGLLALLRPHWFVLTFFLSAFIAVGVFALFGADKTWGGMMRIFSRYVARSPEQGRRMAVRMDGIALRWDGFLDRFPEGTVDGLYLPDFQSLQEAEERHEAVVDERLSRMQAEG